MYRKIEMLYLVFSLRLYLTWLIFKRNIFIYIALGLLVIILFGLRMGYSYYMANTRIGVRGDSTFFWYNLLGKPTKVYYSDCVDTLIIGVAKADILLSLEVPPDYKNRTDNSHDMFKETYANKYRAYKCNSKTYSIEVYERTPEIIDNLNTLFKKGK